MIYRRERALVYPGANFWCRGQGPGLISWIDTLRAVAEVEIGASGQPRSLLQPRAYLFLGSASIRRRLHEDRRTRAQVSRKRAAGCLHGLEVGQAIPQRSGHSYHGHVKAGTGVRLAGCLECPSRISMSDMPPWHVLEGRVERIELFLPAGNPVVADDPVAGRHGLHSQRKADVSHACYNNSVHSESCPATGRLAPRLRGSLPRNFCLLVHIRCDADRSPDAVDDLYCPPSNARVALLGFISRCIDS